MIQDANYYFLKPDSFQVKLITRQRRIMYRRFVELLNVDEYTTIVDVGVTSDRTFENSNYLEAWHPHSHNITAIGLDDASFLTDFPGLTFVRGNGLALPFRDEAFDVAHCSAVIEHVGNFANQANLLGECARVCRRGFLITTPYRWFPIEVHTSLPLLHWLPKAWHRAILSRLGFSFYCQEENLNLLDKRALRSTGELLAGFTVEVHAIRLLGWSSNLLLLGKRIPPKADSALSRSFPRRKAAAPRFASESALRQT
jgi:hypothetical protein